eukprot:142468_1
MSASFLTGEISDKIEILLSGFCRKPINKEIPNDILNLCYQFYSPIIYWNVPAQQFKKLKHRYRSNTQTLKCGITQIPIDYGPSFDANEYNFQLCLKIAKKQLFFAASYDSKQMLQNAMNKYLINTYTQNVINIIISSYFEFMKHKSVSITQPTFAYTQPTYQAYYLQHIILPVLNHIKQQLKSVITDENSLKNIISDVKQLLQRFSDKSEKLCFRMRMCCKEPNIEYRGLYKCFKYGTYAAVAPWEFGTNFNWYSDKYLAFKRFHKYDCLTFSCYVEILSEGRCNYLKPKDANYEWKIDGELFDEIKKCKDGTVFYAPQNFGYNEIFCVYVECYKSKYGLVVQLLGTSSEGENVNVNELVMRVDCNEKHFHKVSRMKASLGAINLSQREVTNKVFADRISWCFGDKSTIRNMRLPFITVSVMASDFGIVE